MTPEQESKDTRQFKILLVSNWLNFGLVLLLVYVFVSLCRLSDMNQIKSNMEEIKKLLKDGQCVCEKLVQQNNNQQVHIDRPMTFEDQTWALVKMREQEKNNQPVSAKESVRSMTCPELAAEIATLQAQTATLIAAKDVADAAYTIAFTAYMLALSNQTDAGNALSTNLSSIASLQAMYSVQGC